MRAEAAPYSRFEIGFLLWLCRHLARPDADDGLLDREIVCCFGDDLGFAARAAADGLRPVVMQLQPRMARQAGSPPTYSEQVMLSVYDLLRSGMENEAQEIADDLFGARTGLQFVEHAGCLAKLFALQATDADAAPLARFRGITAAHNPGGALPPAMAAAILFASRLWVVAHRTGSDPSEALRAELGQTLRQNDLAAIDQVFGNVCVAARRGVKINCTCHAEITTDENAFLDAVVAMMSGDREPASRLMAEWQHPAAARKSCEALLLLAQKQERAPAAPETGNRRRPH